MPVKTVTVTFEVPGVTTNDAIKLLLMDALGEFISMRTPVDVYVQERYSPEFLSTHPLKEAQVQARINLAAMMCSGIDFPRSVVTPDIQEWEAKLQRQQELEARVNDLYARMQQYAEDISLYEELWDERKRVEAWLEALEWVRGGGSDPLKEDSDA